METNYEEKKWKATNRFKDILTRANFNSLASFCLNDIDSLEKNLENFQIELESSEVAFFDKMEQLFPEFNRENDDFYEIFTDLLVFHEEVYFEIGLVTGMIFNEDLKQKYNKLLKDTEIGSNILSWLSSRNV